MKLENSFTVPAAPERAWELLMDVPRVVPCMPGAELTETLSDDAWTAEMTVKLGPISLRFGADIERLETDEAARRVVLGAKARELRGRGGAHATIASRLTPEATGTRVDIVTELTLSGMAAQYGRAVVADVSAQLTQRFATSLRAELDRADASEAPGAADPARPPDPAPAVSGFALAFGALRRSLVRWLRSRARSS